MKAEKIVFPAALLIVSSLSLLIFLKSHWGIGVTHDSIFYLSSAGNLLNHKGLQWFASDGSLHPLTHFPPLYSLALALFMAFGIPGTRAATWLAGIWLGLNIFTAGYLVFRFSHSKILSIMAPVTLAITTGFVNLHLIALSEPLCMWLTLCSLGALGIYFEESSRKWLWVAAVLSALSVLTRYIGIAVIATGFLAIAALEKTSFRSRIRNLLIYTSISLTPLVLWALRNFLLAGSTTNRALLYHALDWGNRKLGFETISGWFTASPVSYRTTIGISGLFLGTIFIWCLWLGWKLVFSKRLDSNKTSTLRVVFMLNLFSLIYLAGILFSLTFFDASTRLDGRILAPLYISFLLALFTMLGSFSFRLQWIGGLISILLILINLPGTMSTVSDFAENGRGFTGRAWQTSPSVAYVRDAAAGSVIYSNQGMALYFLTNRPTYDVPEKMDVVRHVEREGYASDLGLMKERLGTPGSFLVWFVPSALSDAVLQESGVELNKSLTFPDAKLYIMPEGKNNP